MYAQAVSMRSCARPCLVRPVATIAPAPGRAMRCLVIRASSSASDPYSVLGVPPTADTNEINRAYTRLKYQHRANTTESGKIEKAHSAIMMNQFNMRVKGGASNEIKFADTEVLFPWRPKRWDATPQVILVVGAVQLGMAAFAFNQPSMSKVVACMLIGMVGNFVKQNAISPPPKDPSYATEEEQARGGKNFVRAALLGLLATMLGISLIAMPEYALTQYKSAPGILATLNVPSMLVSCKVAATAIANWIMTAYYY